MTDEALKNNEVSKAEFARILGCKRSYVTQLHKADRLELSGSKVLVHESLIKIEASKDPSKQNKAIKNKEVATSTNVDASIETAPPADAEFADSSNDNPTYQNARAKREHFLSLAADRDFLISAGQLVRVDELRRVAMSAGATIRSQLELMKNVLAPQLAQCADEAEVEEILSEQIENTLSELDRILRTAGTNA